MKQFVNDLYTLNYTKLTTVQRPLASVQHPPSVLWAFVLRPLASIQPLSSIRLASI